MNTSSSSSHPLHPEIEPWPSHVDGSLLLTDLTKVLTRFVVLPPHAAEALALWVLHTYAFQLRTVSAYLGIESPQKRCGKTTLLSVLSQLVHRPIVASNISPSAFFRVIEETRPTLLIDEADTLLQGNDELRGILNSGHTPSTAFVLRVAPSRSPFEVQGSKFKVQGSESATPSSILHPPSSILAPLPCTPHSAFPIGPLLHLVPQSPRRHRPPPRNPGRPLPPHPHAAQNRRRSLRAPAPPRCL